MRPNAPELRCMYIRVHTQRDPLNITRSHSSILDIRVDMYLYVRSSR